LTLFGAGLFAAPTDAQAACELRSPTFFPSGLQPSGWYYWNPNPPHTGSKVERVRFEVDVDDCAGKRIKVDLMNSPPGGFAQRLHGVEFNVPSSSTGNGKMQYSFKVGETGCSGAASVDCYLSLKGYVDGAAEMNSYINPSTWQLNPSQYPGILGYNCSAVCSDGFNEGDPNWPAFTPPAWAGGTGGGGGGNTTNLGDNFKKLQNPIAYDNIPDVIRQLITIVFVIGIPLVALAIIYAGFLLVTAGGNQEKIKKGKQALLAAVIGGAILLGAWVIAEAIQGTVDQIRTGS